MPQVMAWPADLMATVGALSRTLSDALSTSERTRLPLAVVEPEGPLAPGNAFSDKATTDDPITGASSVPLMLTSITRLALPSTLVTVSRSWATVPLLSACVAARSLSSR